MAKGCGSFATPPTTYRGGIWLDSTAPHDIPATKYPLAKVQQSLLVVPNPAPPNYIDRHHAPTHATDTLHPLTTAKTSE